MALTPGTNLGPYQILAPIGEGGMGEVYRARDSRLGRVVAIKVSKEQFSERFEREARLIAQLNHPNIAALYDVGPDFLVLEYVEGPTLADRLRSGAIPIEEALPLARQIAEALDAAHEKGIIHRDLKPANIKITPEGKVKVLDFGLARATETSPPADPTSSPTLTLTIGGTHAGMILGTAGYMSPEQARGMQADKRADIWSFGVVVFEMLTAQRLFDGDTISDTLAAVLRADLDWNRLPPNPVVRRMLRRCLERDRKQRRRDIGDVVAEIDEAIAGPPVDSLAPPPAKLPWAVAALLLLVVGALSWLHFREAPPIDRVLRYAIRAPENAQVHTFALSPDGRFVAIAAAAPSGTRQLWLQRLDTLAPQQLNATEDAMYPFWSPDSRTIGFFAGGKLKTIAVDGGPPQVLCDAADGRGGAWNSDGVIVFAPASTAPSVLHRVAALGGTPVPVAKLDGVQVHRSPVFLPDGNQFLYTASGLSPATGAPDQRGIFLGSLDGRPPRRILPDVSSVLWAPLRNGSHHGHILYQRARTLLAQPFDADTAKTAGDAFPIAEQVAQTNADLAVASVSRDGLLAYWTGRDRTEQTQLIWYDRAGNATGNVRTTTRSLDFSLSPDAKTIAATRPVGQDGNTDIWLHDLARGVDTRFTVDASQNGRPVWSPDSRQLVFYSNRGGVTGLYVKATSGGPQESLLIKSKAGVFPSDWSSDHKTLLYRENKNNAKDSDLFTIDLQGDKQPVRYLESPFREVQGQFSPDGKWIAYASDESGRFEIYIQSFPAGSGKWSVSGNGGELPRWRRDGREIFYLAPDRKLMAVNVKVGPGALTMERPKELFEVRIANPIPGRNQWPYAVTPDGQRFLVATTTGDSRETPITVVVNWLPATRK